MFSDENSISNIALKLGMDNHEVKKSPKKASKKTVEEM
jgi:hypothetical protein